MTKQKKEARFNLLIDTCVWLDVAKDFAVDNDTDQACSNP